MASLTRWENSQLQHIHLLLDQAIETLKEFKVKMKIFVQIRDEMRENTKLMRMAAPKIGLNFAGLHMICTAYWNS